MSLTSPRLTRAFVAMAYVSFVLAAGCYVAALIAYGNVWGWIAATFAGLSLCCVVAAMLVRRGPPRFPEWFGVWVVLSLLGFLTVLFFAPSVSLVRNRAARMRRSNDLKQTVVAMRDYADGNGGRLPPAALR